MISKESRFMAGFLLVVLPTVLYGGLFLLSQLVDDRSGYMANPLRQNLFRAGHAHAGVLLLLSLIALRYVDEANLSSSWKWLVRLGIPSAAIFLFCALAGCHSSECIHQPRLCRRVRVGPFTVGAGNWTAAIAHNLLGIELRFKRLARLTGQRVTAQPLPPIFP